MGVSILRKSFREEPDAQKARVSVPPVRHAKLEQCAKIAELGRALQTAGLYSIGDQAKALGLKRSTIWAILKANYKSTGLTGTIARQMLASSELPPEARRVIEQYVALKLAGAYGHDKQQIRRFRKAVYCDLAPDFERASPGRKPAITSVHAG